jgi:hypothetical protein
MTVFFSAIVKISGTSWTSTEGLTNASMSVGQSANSAAANTRPARTAYWMPRDSRARLRGVIAMTVWLLRVAGPA